MTPESNAAEITPNRMWTLAYRKPTANKFHRVTDWSGTWQDAVDMARVFGAANPGLQVWYVPTASQEAYTLSLYLPGSSMHDSYLLDAGTILVDSGKRIRMTETGTIGNAADLLAAERAELAPIIAALPDGAPVRVAGRREALNVDGFPYLNRDGSVMVRAGRDGISCVYRLAEVERIDVDAAHAEAIAEDRARTAVASGTARRYPRLPVGGAAALAEFPAILESARNAPYTETECGCSNPYCQA